MINGMCLDTQPLLRLSRQDSEASIELKVQKDPRLMQFHLVEWVIMMSQRTDQLVLQGCGGASQGLAIEPKQAEQLSALEFMRGIEVE